MIPDRSAVRSFDEDIAQNSAGAHTKVARRIDDRRRKRPRRGWHRDGARRMPHELRLFDRDVPELIRRWIAPGYATGAGVLSARDHVLTIGSCFAGDVSTHLRELGCSSGGLADRDRLVNTFAILDFLSWCVTGGEIARGYRFIRSDTDEIREWTPEMKQERYLQRIATAGAVVVGFGVAEVWQDRETGAVFWRGVPKDVYSAGRHECRLTTVEENEENLLRIVELIRTANAKAPIVLMLSPLPIRATYTGVECISADCVSKSVLRLAFERLLSRNLEGVYYWPLFEAVRWVGGYLPWRAYGIDDGSPRNATRYLVAEAVEAFVEAFYTPEAVAELRKTRSGGTLPSPGSLRGRVEYPLRRLVVRMSKHAARRRAARGLRR